MTATLTPAQLDAAARAWSLSGPGPRTCICGEVDADIVDTQDRFGLPVTTLHCVACGTLRSSSVVRDEYLAHFYREIYSVMHSGLDTDRIAREVRQAEWLRGYRSLFKQRVLEIGGGCIRHIAGSERIAEYRAYDIAAPTDDVGSGFDVVAAFHVLEHCTDPVATLRAWADRCGDDGRIIVVVPNLLEVHHHRHVKAMGLRGWLQLSHPWNWTQTNIVLPFMKAGLRVVHVERVPAGLLSTVGSIAVEAAREWEIGQYLKGHGNG